jgi:hypothetical protein
MLKVVKIGRSFVTLNLRVLIQAVNFAVCNSHFLEFYLKIDVLNYFIRDLRTRRIAKIVSTYWATFVFQGYQRPIAFPLCFEGLENTLLMKEMFALNLYYRG